MKRYGSMIAILTVVIFVLTACSSSSKTSDQAGSDNVASDSNLNKQDDSSATVEEDTKKEEDEKQEETEKAESSTAETTYTHSYTVVPAAMTWTDAEAYCEEKNGHLPTFTNESEYKEVLEYMNHSGRFVIWLGAKRNESTGEFEWVTGEPMNYTNWADGEPNNDKGNESYVGLMNVNDEWKMYDLPNDLSPYYADSRIGFIVEEDIEE